MIYWLDIINYTWKLVTEYDILCFVFQALYFCVPFREQLLDYYTSNKNIGDVEDNLLTCLADLFSQVREQCGKCVLACV